MPRPWVPLLEEGCIRLDDWNLSNYNLLVRLVNGYVVKPYHASLVEVVWALQTPALGIMARWVKLYNFGRNIEPVITAGLTDTSGLDPSWLVVTQIVGNDIILINYNYNLGWFIH